MARRRVLGAPSLPVGLALAALPRNTCALRVTLSVRRPEILAPAGDRATLEAAVRAGADAVYFGVQGFNARARASNFDEATLDATMRHLHEHGVKGYLALNTLVFDDELPAVERLVRAAAAAAVDAVIVQDLAVARLITAVAPTLPIHASTQMTCTDAASVELARSMGARRVVLARELSLEDIAAIRTATDVEVEVFVHGALCIAYSGQCLTSEAFGGRSANRGACAQACRLPYELVVDGQPHDLGDRAHLLSPEDLETSALVPDLVRLGVSCLKIEGRLKGPEYVAATTKLYREAVSAAVGEGSLPSGSTREAALLAYSRGSGPGFLPGVDHQRLVEGRTCEHRGVPLGGCEGTRRARGKTFVLVRLDHPIKRGDGVFIEGGRASEGEVGGRVWTIVDAGGNEREQVPAGKQVGLWLGPEREAQVTMVRSGRRVFRSGDPALARATMQSLHEQPARTPIEVRVSGTLGSRPNFEARTARGGHAVVQGDAPIEAAQSHATDATVLRDKLGRLGGTPFSLGELRVDLPPHAMVPLSTLNHARRALVSALIAETSGPHSTTTATAKTLVASSVAAATAHARPPGGLFVLCRTPAQARAALSAGADGVYLDFLELTGTGDCFRQLRASGARFVGLAPPRIRKPGEEKIDRYLAALGADGLLVRGLGALHELSCAPSAETFATERTVLRVGDFSLNVTNAISAAEVLARGVGAFTPSFDLNEAQLLALLTPALAPLAEVVLHHPMPLFHMEHCVIAALLSEGRDHRTCGRPCERHQVSLRDRAGMEHPVEADVGCRNTVFHAAAQSAAALVPRLVAAGVQRFRIELVREDAREVARIVGAYRSLLQGRSAPRDVWRGLRTAGGYGVVSGSLRVIR